MDERNNHFDFDFTPIGQAIKKAREARGMTREELSGMMVFASILIRPPFRFLTAGASCCP